MYIDDWEIIYAKELLMIEFESLHACKENYVYEEKKNCHSQSLLVSWKIGGG